MMRFYFPDDPRILAAVGKVTLRHAQLDHILRMTIKSLTGVTTEEVLNATCRQTSGTLRVRIEKIARRTLGEGKAFIQLQDLLERCKRASYQRNDLVHKIWGKDLDGDDAKVHSDDHTWGPPPTVEDLDRLSDELEGLRVELTEARFEGFLAEALKKRKATKK